MKKLFKTFFTVLVIVGFHLANGQDIPKWKVADLQAAINNAKQPTIFNFWATFCKPCLEELPYFQEVVKKYDSAGVKLVLVNLDMAEAYPTKIKATAKKRNISYPITFLDETNADLFCPIVDPKWSGAIPASLFINKKTGYRQFYEDQLTKEKLEKELLKMIQ